MPVQISIDSSGVSKALQWVAAVNGKLPTATSFALNKLAFQVSQDLRNQVGSFLDQGGPPNAYTRKGFFYEKSTRFDLTARVTAGNPKDPNDRRRRYLATQIAGGRRGRKGAEIKTGSYAPALQGQQLVPTRGVKRDTSGNVQRALWSKINASNPNIFVGVPRGGSRSLGVYERRGRTLKALMLAKQQTNYGTRFPMERIADQVIRRNWPTYLTSSLTQALARVR